MMYSLPQSLGHLTPPNWREISTHSPRSMDLPQTAQFPEYFARKDFIKPQDGLNTSVIPLPFQIGIRHHPYIVVKNQLIAVLIHHC